MPRTRAPRSTHSKIGLMAHKAVRVHTRTHVLVKAAILLLGAAGLAAASAFITVQQSRIRLTAALQTPPSSSTQTSGSKDVPVLGVNFRGGTTDTSVRGLTLGFLGDTDGDFRKNIANDLRPSDVIDSCVLQDGPNNRVSGPISFVPGASVLSFAMDVPLLARKTISLRVVCDLAKQKNQNGDPDRFAFFVPATSAVLAVDASGKTIPSSGVSFRIQSRINANGRDVSILVKDASAPTPAPTPAPVVTAPVPAPSVGTSITVSYADDPPRLSPTNDVQRAGIPGLSSALRFEVKAATSGDALLHGFTYKLLSIDQRASGWNLCENLGSSSRWGMRDLNDPSTRLEDAGDWSFYQENGEPCVAGKVLVYAVVDFSRAGDREGKRISAGVPYAYAVRLDTSAASSSLDDLIRVDMPNATALHALAFPLKALRWSPEMPLGAPVTDDVPSLPVQGATTIY